MALQITYALTGAGWAQAEISSGPQTVRMTVSYLHDTLGQLAEAALALLSPPWPPQRIIFMDEPGEHQLQLTPGGAAEVAIELRWYADWQSWGMHPADQYDTLLRATTTASDFAQTVANLLDVIWITYGPEQYKEEWIEHEFPTSAYHKLVETLSG